MYWNLETIENLLALAGECDALTVYNNAVEAYELGSDSIMSDSTFDYLQAQLIAKGLITKQAGANQSALGTEHAHFVPMLSVHSIHQTDWGLHTTDIVNCVTYALDNVLHAQAKYVDISPKLDGCAIEVQYIDGIAVEALTRGDGVNGLSVFAMFKDRLPTLNVESGTKHALVGEMAISKDNYAKHCAHLYKNERSAVQGITASSVNEERQTLAQYVDTVFFKLIDVNTNTTITSRKFLAEIVSNPDMLNTSITINVDGLMSYVQIASEYEAVLNFRTDYKYRLDGVVFNIAQHNLEIAGPNYVGYCAIKMPAVTCTTIINSIHWSIKNNGELFPTLIISPVYIDGTTVNRASVFNIDNILRQGLTPGTEIEIIKSGDIIPHVSGVITKMHNTDELMQAWLTDEINRLSELFGSTIIHEGVNLKLANKNVTSVRRHRFITGALALDVDGLGVQFASSLFDMGYSSTLELLNIDADVTVMLHADASAFQDGKDFRNTHSNLVKRMQHIHIAHLIYSMRITGLGKRKCEVIAHIVSQYWEDMSVLSQWQNILNNISKVDKYCANFVHDKDFADDRLLLRKALTEHGDQLFYNEVSAVAVPADVKRLLLTGSPKPYWSTKDAFIADLDSTKYIVVGDAKAATCLVTNSPDSTSNKTKWAKANNIEILTYAQFKD